MRSLLFGLPLVVFAGFAVTAYVGMQREDTEELPSAIIGNIAPAVKLEPMSGLVPFANVDLTSDGISLVNFWASWCAPCRAEHPTLMELSEKGVAVFGVNYKDDPNKAAAFLAELGNPYKMGGADPRARMAVDWGVYGLPETFVLGPDGKVIARVAGPLTQRNLETRVLPELEKHGLSIK